MTRWVAMVLVMSMLTTAVAAIDPGARCAASKLKAAARKSSSKLKCHATAAARRVDVDLACLAKAETKFAAAWQRIEAAGGCHTTGDESEIEGRVDTLVFALALELAPCGTVDGVCGGTCPFGLNCFEIGVGCLGEPEPCRCHGSTTTCPPTTTTSTTLP